jgi:hypothetical protein
LSRPRSGFRPVEKMIGSLSKPKLSRYTYISLYSKVMLNRLILNLGKFQLIFSPFIQIVMHQENTIIYHTYADLQEATIILDKLNANGIQAYLKNENVLGLDPVGGVELRIFEKDLAEVENILAQ